jgi:hypothetical protein
VLHGVFYFVIDSGFLFSTIFQNLGTARPSLLEKIRVKELPVPSVLRTLKNWQLYQRARACKVLKSVVI